MNEDRDEEGVKRKRRATWWAAAGLVFWCSGCGKDKGPREGDNTYEAWGGVGEGNDASGGRSSGGSHHFDGGSGGVEATGGAEGGSGGGHDGGGSVASGGTVASGGHAATGGDCGALLQALCDDANDCTLDTCTLEGCHHEPVSDGTSCDDNDACTLGDLCAAGVCSGEPIASSALLLESLRSFGSYTPYTATGNVDFSEVGLSLALDEDMLVFSEPGGTGKIDLVLVEVDDSGLRRLDTVPTEFGVTQSAVGIWPAVLGSHLVRLSASRFALVSAPSGIAIYDVVDGDLTLAAQHDVRVEDGLNAGLFWDAKGRGTRLWILATPFGLHAYDIAPDGSPSWLADVEVPAKTSAFALSTDGQTVYAGGQLGTFRIDVSDLAQPVVEDQPVLAPQTESRPRQMTLHEDHLFIQTDKVWDTIGDARLYRVPSLELVMEFPSTLEEDSPLGADFTENGLLLQRLLYESYEPSTLQAELYDLSAGTPHLVDSMLYADLAALEDHRQYRGFPPTAYGSLAVLNPLRRVVSLHDETLTEVNGALQGTFNELRTLEDGSILASSPLSSHRLALHDGEPQLVAGGMLQPGTSSLYRLTFSESGGASPRAPFLLGPTGLRESSGGLSWLETAPDQPARPGGSFELPGPPSAGHAYQLASDGMLFRMAQLNDAAPTVRVFSLPRTAEDLTTMESLPPIEISTTPYSGIFAVAKNGRAFVLEGEAAEEDHRAIHWYEWTGERFELAVSEVQSFPGANAPAHAILHGDSLVTLSTDDVSLHLFERDGPMLNLTATRNLESERDPTVQYYGFLGIEGERLYVAASIGRGTTAPQDGVDVLSMEDLSFIARYPTRQRVTSFAHSGKHLVMGSQNTVFTATPQCEMAGEAPPVGDANQDGCVDQADYDLLDESYNLSVDHVDANPSADFNEDGWVDFLDYLILYESWGDGC